MKCFHCKNNINEFSSQIKWTSDGDSFCDQNCESAYERERDSFFNEVINNDAKFDNWLLHPSTDRNALPKKKDGFFTQLKSILNL